MIAHFEGVLSAQNVHHLIAVVMEVERCFGAGRSYLLERHDTLPGLFVLQLECCRSAGRHVPYWFLSRQRDEAFSFHRGFLQRFPYVAAMLSRAYSFAGLKANLGTFSARGQPIPSPVEFSGRYQSGDGPEIVLDRGNELRSSSSTNAARLSSRYYVEA
jgi:hypothetical protein